MCTQVFQSPTVSSILRKPFAAWPVCGPLRPDFVLMWDNAYCMHEFDSPYVPFPDILTLCREAGNPDMVFEFASTSKITLPGAGMSVMAASEANIQYMQKRMGVQMISTTR